MKDIINAIDELQKSVNEAKDKHMKGYIYDSLVYRYIRAREAMAERDWSLHKEHDKGFYYRQANRDIMRFCQILDEAIGEHD
jgi:flagellin-specific chaperone FliS